MPILPTAADLGERPAIQPVTQRVPSGISDAPARALEQAGAQMRGVGMDLMDMRARNQYEADKLRAEDAHNSLLQGALDLKDGNDGFSQVHGTEVLKRPLLNDYMGKFDVMSSQIESGLATPQQKEMFKQRQQVARLQYQEDLLRHINHEGGIASENVYKAGVVTELNNAAAHYLQPAVLAVSAAHIRSMVADQAERNGWGDPSVAGTQANEELVKHLSDMHQMVVTQALDGENLKYAKEYFAKVNQELDEQGRHAISKAIDIKQRELDAEARQRQTLARFDLGEKVRDLTAASFAGVDTSKMPQVGLADFRAAYGDTGGERYKEFQKTLAMSESVPRLALASPAEQRDILASFKPAPEAGFAGNQERYDKLLEITGRLNKAREDDPAQYAIARLPQVSDAYQAMLAAPQDEGAARDYVQKVQAASADMGIQNEAVLPKVYADSIVSRFYKQDAGGEPAAIHILSERQKWGAAWPAVWKQIAPDIPSAAFVIGLGMNPESGRRLAEVSTVKMEELTKQLPAGDKPKDISDKVRSNLDDAVRSYAGQPGSDKLAANLVDSAERLAIRYRAAGKSIGDAASQAAKEVFNERYNFYRAGDSTLRVPNQYQFGDVKDAVKTATGDLRRAGFPRLDESSWVTLPDDSGIALTWMGGLVDGPDGKPIIHTWDALLNRSATQRRSLELDRESLPAMPFATP